MTCFFSVGRCDYRLLFWSAKHRAAKFRSEWSLVLLGEVSQSKGLSKYKDKLVIMGKNTLVQCFATVNIQY